MDRILIDFFSKQLKKNDISTSVLDKVIRIFDTNIKNLSMIDEKHYKLSYKDTMLELSDSELIYMLSSGATKGLLLYVYI